jgi:peptidoglycan/LPS O-acetylase OafA/YrhL
MSRQFPALRGLAIIIVVLYHSIHMSGVFMGEAGIPVTNGIGGIILMTFTLLGVFAVPTFLFISGSFFIYSIRGQESRLSYRTVFKGLKHILLPYLIWSLVFYLILYLWHDRVFSPFEYFKHLVVGYPFNFVPLIVFFYLLSPVLVRLSKKYSFLIIAIIAGYQIFLINVLHPGTLGFIFPDWTRFLVVPVLGRSIADWGIYFPLGMVFSLHAGTLTPYLLKIKWALAGATAAFFILGFLSVRNVLDFQAAYFIAPLPFVGFAATISRSSIPIVKSLEAVGKRSYGLYLTNLIVLDTVLYAMTLAAPQMLNYQLVIVPVLFALSVGIPMAAMSGLARMPKWGMYRFVFG